MTIITVGKSKEKYLKEAVSEYSKRLSKCCRLEIMEVPDEKAPESVSIIYYTYESVYHCPLVFHTFTNEINLQCKYLQ